ncbi:MAG: hypothetical protein JWQ00_257 [Noviherbaspirillum sp.]|nr:hypothetical protein [Noviherbaspirillum sp.]
MVLAGCSAIRLGYSNGESVVFWWLNSYVDVEADQQPWVKRHIANLLAWHRSTQLEQYANLLARIQKQLQGNVTPADVLNEYGKIKHSALVLVDKAVPELADLAVSLHPQQIANIEKKFASNNENYRKENMRDDLERRQLDRYKKLMKQAEYWFGDFSPDQEAQIRIASDARPLNRELELEMRKKRQQEVIAMLKKVRNEKLDQKATTGLMKEYMDDVLDYFGRPEHKAFADASQNASAHTIALIINMTDETQRAHARKRLQKWIDDCRALAAQGANDARR